VTGVKRFLLTLVLAAGLAAWVGAEDAASRPSAVVQKELLHRNRALLDGLIDDGLKLASKPAPAGPLERAEICQLMAVRMKGELLQASKAGERDRGAELAQLLRGLVVDGVAKNLGQARKQIPPQSQEEKRLFDLRDQTTALLKDAVEALGQFGAPAERTRQSLADSQAEVEKAVAPGR
jgi:hypothetical protein